MMFGKNKGARETAKRIPPGSVGVEIGVWRGASAALFLRRRLAHLHLVDPWSVDVYRKTGEFGGFMDFLNRYTPLVGSADPDDFQAYYDTLAEAVARRFRGQPVTIHRKTSRDFFVEHLGGAPPFDWAYLDGSHSYVEVMNDLICAGQVCRGSVFGDDYGNKPGVTRAVDDYVQQRGCFLDVFADNQYEISDAPI